ncbi:chaperonin 10-like protein [Mycotypha africana]|uniref:chaperonin 10-like protein n=1 Tax=Mycotypha africana TaxID=64632 RepID=UPI002301DBEA|nr:chaperonin 10-like protein [Mycotypha africana]KAI8988028.1 chaperonin 10-like protein [Mycotypha africana]
MSIASADEFIIPTKDNVNQGNLLKKKDDLSMVEIPVPEPTAGHVPVQVKCTGEGVTRLQVGDRVAIETGRYHLCPDVIFKFTPPHDGQLAKYITHPARWLHRIPACISYGEGALLEPLSVAIAAIDRVGVKFGKSLLITGSGPIGLVVIAVAKAAGVYPIGITDVNESEHCNEVRALFGGEGVEYSLEYTGIESSFRTAIMATRDAGTCCLVGMGKNDQIIPVNNFAT